MGNTNRKPSTDEDKLRSIYAKYKKHIIPLEEKSLFNSLGDQAYTEEEILAKNMILILGQYSTGKTTFIRALLSGREYPGMNIAADPATDKFIPIIRGDTKKNIPGNALIYDQSYPFGGFSTAFGEDVRQQLSGASLPAAGEGEDDIMNDVILVDTPGTLDGAEDKRKFNLAEVVGWFGSRAALILILFDVHRMGVSAEMSSVLDNISGNRDKIRFIINKADTVSDKNLMSAVGGLKFSLAQAMPKNPEPPEIYITSLENLKDEYKTENQEFSELFAYNKGKLMDDIQMVRDDGITRKIDMIDKRMRLVRNHADVMRQLRKEQPKYLSMFHRKLNQNDKSNLINEVPKIYEKIQKSSHRSPEEFIPLDTFKEKLNNCDLNNLPKIRQKNVTNCYENIQKAIKNAVSK